MPLRMYFVCFLVGVVGADNFLMLFNPFSQSHIFHLLPITKELLRCNKMWFPGCIVTASNLLG